VLADANAEIPFTDAVIYAVQRLRRVGYLPHSKGYLKQVGLTLEERQDLPGMTDKEIAALVARAESRDHWQRDVTAHLHGCHVGLAAVVGEDARSSLGIRGPAPLSLLERYAALNSSDVCLYIGIDPGTPDSLAIAREAISHPHAAGLAVLPMLAGYPLSAPPYAATLRFARDHGLPIWVHSSSNFFPGVSYDVGHPRHVDKVLRSLPGLRIIIGHAGWPWVQESCIIALRHPTVALEFSTFPPRVITEASSGFTPLLQNLRTLRGRIFFGSGAVWNPAHYRKLIGQLNELPITDELPSWQGDGLAAYLRRT